MNIEQATSSIAKLMGIDDIRPGRHILRNEKRWRIGELQISHAWHAAVEPSFHDRAVLAVVRADDTEFRGEMFPGFFRAGIAIIALETTAPKQAVVADIEYDPLPATIKAIDLLACNDSMWLDGICYELFTSTTACDSHLRFSNPTLPSFRSVEDALFSIAQQIAVTSAESTICEFVDMWHDYIVDSERET